MIISINSYCSKKVFQSIRDRFDQINFIAFNQSQRYIKTTIKSFKHYFHRIILKNELFLILDSTASIESLYMIIFSCKKKEKLKSATFIKRKTSVH